MQLEEASPKAAETETHNPGGGRGGGVRRELVKTNDGHTLAHTAHKDPKCTRTEEICETCQPTLLC